MSPPRVLVLNHNLPERGTWFRALRTAEAFAARGARVTMVCTGPGRWRLRAGWRGNVQMLQAPHWSPVYGPDSGWSPLGAAARLGLSLRGWDAVMSFSHKPVDQLPARLSRSLCGARWACDWCDLWGEDGLNALQRAQRGPAASLHDRASDACDSIDARLEQAAARDCDVLTVISTDLARRAAALGRDERRALLYPSGADLDGIRPLDRARCRRALGLEEGRFLVGYVSSWHPDEGLLLRALSRACAQAPALQLLAAGAPVAASDAELRALGLRGRVTHLGRLPYRRLSMMLGACDAAVLPLEDTAFNRSRWPNKICDYLAAGRAIVAGEVGDVARLMAEGVGWGASPNAEALAAALLEAASNPAEAHRRGAAARAHAQEHRRWERLAQPVWDRLLG